MAAAGGSSGGGGNKSFVANVVRRTWDLTEYEEKAKEKARAELEAEAAADARARNRVRAAQALVVRAPLKHREAAVQLESRLGKRAVVSTATPLAGQGGYYCDVCECLLKDSNTYLDHINGKKHQRALGMTLRAERSTLGEVKAKLEDAKRRTDEAASGSELEQRLARFQDELDASKRERKEERRAEERQRKDNERRANEAEAQFNALGATSSDARKRRKQQEGDSSSSNARDGSVEDEEERGSKKARSESATDAASAAAAATPAAAEEEEEEDPEAAMMRAMGFSTGFAQGKNK
jgi:U4/U6.U5 tri-snRNP component SNU23